jgi:penicillin amidase
MWPKTFFIVTSHRESAWPGGTSGAPGDRFYVNLLPAYLTNDSLPLLFRNGDLQTALYSVNRFVPATN